MRIDSGNAALLLNEEALTGDKSHLSCKQFSPVIFHHLPSLLPLISWIMCIVVFKDITAYVQS